jgi:hypothetical protein
MSDRSPSAKEVTPFPKPYDGVNFNDSRVKFREETETHIFTGPDGIDYEWDTQQQGWFPMVNYKDHHGQLWNLV